MKSVATIMFAVAAVVVVAVVTAAAAVVVADVVERNSFCRPRFGS